MRSKAETPAARTAGPGFGEILFHHLQHVRPAMPRHDDAMMFHTR
jgi:hypothetical protein